jgi:hypothetical protein
LYLGTCYQAQVNFSLPVPKQDDGLHAAIVSPMGDMPGQPFGHSPDQRGNQMTAEYSELATDRLDPQS